MMFVVMKSACSRQDVERVIDALPAMSAAGAVSASGRVIEVLEGAGNVDRTELERFPAVACVLDRPTDVMRACHASEAGPVTVPLGAGAVVGGQRLAVIAGPCSVEDPVRLFEAAHAVAEAGAVGLRGGVFKPRTAPYSFQGLGDAGLDMLAEVRAQTELAIVTEVMSVEHIERVAAVADVLQVGSRNMHNSMLLRAVGEQSKPVLLKRGWSATLEEFVLAAEYIRQAGNPQVILCERGIRTFEDYVRNTLALAVVPEAQRVTGLPVIVDPSHGTGKAHLVAPMCRAAVACGADGLLIEAHPAPAQAWSDGEQTLSIEDFQKLIPQLRRVAAACEREL